MLARTSGVKLVISWLPDKGSDSAKAPGCRRANQRSRAATAFTIQSKLA